jgi:2-C-methyl-D-erythritol 4-phosphate cytidylyltransferase / 2-C-methyl-D-erythritol 2,4-cyclodiphosphate synthase
MRGAVAVIVAAGRGTRLGSGVPKQFLELAGRSVVSRAVAAMTECAGIDGAVVVVAPEEIGGPRAHALAALPSVRAVVPGGLTRMRSSLAGVEAASDAEIVLVHDAARPFVDPEVVARVLDAARRHGAAVPALEVWDTVKSDDGSGFVAATLDRAALRLAQTPQAARREILLEALREAVRDGFEATDEAQAIERAGIGVALVAGDPGNVKITSPEDWDRAVRRAGGGGGSDLRVGHGYDVHRFGGTGPLVLGGTVFEGEAGLAGHSDADVVLHAAMDAVLGAAALPDIGHHFPPGDAAYAGADSRRLAAAVTARLATDGWAVANLDLTIVAERPKIGLRVEAMRRAVASCFGVDPARVGVKATTHEGLGALGRGEGIACHAVALVRSVRTRP